MAFDPDYGQTLASDEELEALTDAARGAFGEHVRKADLYDAEQAIWADVAQARMAAVLDGSLAVGDILTDRFVRSLHADLYGAIWTWAGRYRLRETNIGVAPEQIAVDLRSELDSLRWRWEHTTHLTAQVLGIAAHAIVVRVHPFVDGNGRTTRLLADLTFAAAQTDDQFLEFDWQLDRGAYIRLLREFDQTRDPGSLAEFVQVRPVSN